MPDADGSTLRSLRRTRRDHRLGDIEWFEVLYRVYLFALVGLTVVVIASDGVAGVLDDDVTTADVVRVGPSLLGVLVGVALFVGSRNGAEGGPVSIEPADARHLLLSPISRRRVMTVPIVQRVRAVAFAFALGGAVLGQFVAREVEGSRISWAASSALFGVVVGVVYAGSATITHGLRLDRRLVTGVTGGLLAWQVIAASRTWNGESTTGPFDAVGSLALWGVRQRTTDLVVVAITCVVAIGAIAVGGRLRVESLESRGQLVSQLRFAATVHDLRTVVLLRRQLRTETLRRRPWLGARDAESPSSPPRPADRPSSATGKPPASAVHRRGAHGLRRLPGARWLRMVSGTVIAGLAGSLVVSTSPLFLLLLVAALFAVCLEAIEPLSQEVDHPSRTEGLPVDRGWLFVHHLVVPAGVLAALSLIGATAVAFLEPDHAAAAFAIAVPVVWGGAIGPVVSTIRDAAAPIEVATTTWNGSPRDAESPFALPEFAGMSNVVSGLVPVVLSSVGAIPVIVMRVEPSAANALRAAIAVGLLLGVLVIWVRRRDVWAVAIRRFLAQGRAERSTSLGAGT
jgi:hypothetical protein